MKMRLREIIRKWPILGTGLCIVAVLLFMTSTESSVPSSGERNAEQAAAASIAQQAQDASAIPAAPPVAMSSKSAVSRLSVAPTTPERSARTDVMSAPGSLPHDHSHGRRGALSTRHNGPGVTRCGCKYHDSRRRSRGGPPGVSQVPSLPFLGTGQEHPGTVAGRNHRPESRQ